MRKIFKHPLFLGGIGSILLTIITFFAQGGFGAMNPRTLLYIVGFVIGLGLIIVSIVMTIRQEEQQKAKALPEKELGLHDIVPILQRMDARLVWLAHREAKRVFNFIRYVQVNSRINEALGVDIENKPQSPEDVRQIISKLEPQMKEKISGKEDILDLLPELEVQSGILDDSGYGLKHRRNKDKEYGRALYEIGICRNEVTDDELNRMIKDHIHISEVLANFLLAKERGARLLNVFRVFYKMDAMSPQFAGRLEQLEYRMSEYIASIRLAINGRIDELEGKKPYIEVIPERYSLVVTNKGAFATFAVSIKIVRDYMNYQTNRVYKGIWQGFKNYETKIMKDAVATVVVATQIQTPATNPPVLGLAFPFYDLDSGQELFWQSGLWFWTPKEQESKPLRPEYELEVTINSYPEMLHTFVRNYKLDLDGLHELNEGK